LKNGNAQDIVELVYKYEVANRAEGKSPKTVDGYNQILKAFSDYLKTKHVRSDLSFMDVTVVREYILYLKQRPNLNKHRNNPQKQALLSPTTIQDHVRTLKAFASWLFYERYTDLNRLQTLKVPKAPVKIIDPLKPEEIRKIIATLDKKSYTGSRNLALLNLLLDSGLRASEGAAIDLANMDLAGGFIKVMGKGAKERIVPIGNTVRMMLFNYVDKVRPEPFPSAGNNLFLSSDGKLITANTIKLMFSHLAKDSGVKRLHAHLCRHTFATNYLFNGGDIFSLKEILGHTTFEMVNRYLHFTNSQITALHQKFSPIDKLQVTE